MLVLVYRPENRVCSRLIWYFFCVGLVSFICNFPGLR
jgi:hypothetical protein